MYLTYPPDLLESQQEHPPDRSGELATARTYFEENGGDVSTMSKWTLRDNPDHVAGFACHGAK